MFATNAETLEKYLGHPVEFGDSCKLAWDNGIWRVIYYPWQMMIQCHEKLDELGLKWKLINTNHYPCEENIKQIGIWLKEEK